MPIVCGDQVDARENSRWIYFKTEADKNKSHILKPKQKAAGSVSLTAVATVPAFHSFYSVNKHLLM